MERMKSAERLFLLLTLLIGIMHCGLPFCKPAETEQVFFLSKTARPYLVVWKYATTSKICRLIGAAKIRVVKVIKWVVDQHVL